MPKSKQRNKKSRIQRIDLGNGKYRFIKHLPKVKSIQ